MLFIKKEGFCLKNVIILFENQDVRVEERLKDGRIWLNREQLAMLFQVDDKTIDEHIHHILQEEPNPFAIRKQETVQKVGDRRVKCTVDYYSLDIILAISYRVQSKRGAEFRKWFTRILKEYMILGYSENRQRLMYLEKEVEVINKANDKLEEKNKM